MQSVAEGQGETKDIPAITVHVDCILCRQPYGCIPSHLA